MGVASLTVEVAVEDEKSRYCAYFCEGSKKVGYTERGMANRRELYAATGFSRPTQCMGWPQLSTRGSTPKYFRSEFCQLNLRG